MFFLSVWGQISERLLACNRRAWGQLAWSGRSGAAGTRSSLVLLSGAAVGDLQGGLPRLAVSLHVTACRHQSCARVDLLPAVQVPSSAVGPARLPPSLLGVEPVETAVGPVVIGAARPSAA